MKKENKSFLVTGGAGFIGSHIVKRLLGENFMVRVLDNFSTGKSENIKEFQSDKNFELIEGDLNNPGKIKEAIKDVDYVLHQAAIPSVQRSIEHPVRSNDSNISGTLNLLIAARDEGVKKVVFASSSSIYGVNERLPKRENMSPNPVSPYALTKYAGEKYCQIFYKIYGVSTICLRYFNVFGPNQDPTSEYSAVIPKFISLILKDRNPVIFGDGEQSRDFTFVGNVVDANISAAHSDLSGEVINIACGKRITVNKILKLINKVLNKDIKAKYVEERLGDIKHSLADITKAKRLIGYEPEVKFKEGLKESIEWYQKHQKIC